MLASSSSASSTGGRVGGVDSRRGRRSARRTSSSRPTTIGATSAWRWAGRRDVDGVGRSDEPVRVEVRVAGGGSRACSDRKPASAPDAVDQMPLSSRSSVATMPSRRFRASSVRPAGPRRRGSAAPAAPGGGPPRSGRSACRTPPGRRRGGGAPAAPGPARSSADARRPESARARPPVPTSTSDRAVASAAGPRRRTTAAATSADGSSRAPVSRGAGRVEQQASARAVTARRRWRRARPAWSTSRRPDRLHASTLGMINDDVLPDRGGPRTITDCCGDAWHQPVSSCPR